MATATALTGRPSLKTPAITDEIISRLETGEPLTRICKDDHLPHYATVTKWCRDDEHFFARYARARSIGFDIMAEQILDISDNTIEGSKTKTYDDGSTETTTGDMLEHRKLMIESRKWLLSKLRPEKYGDQGGIIAGLAQSTAAGGSSKLTIEFVRPGEVQPAVPVMKGLIEGSAEVVEEE